MPTANFRKGYAAMGTSRGRGRTATRDHGHSSSRPGILNDCKPCQKAAFGDRDAVRRQTWEETLGRERLAQPLQRTNVAHSPALRPAKRSRGGHRDARPKGNRNGNSENQTQPRQLEETIIRSMVDQ